MGFVRQGLTSPSLPKPPTKNSQAPGPNAPLIRNMVYRAQKMGMCLLPTLALAPDVPAALRVCLRSADRREFVVGAPIVSSAAAAITPSGCTRARRWRQPYVCPAVLGSRRPSQVRPLPHKAAQLRSPSLGPELRRFFTQVQ
jgi:hypothetical protein